MLFLFIFFIGFGILFVLKLFYVFNAKRCKCPNRLEGKTFLVTGANSGIGYEISKDLARRGGHVILASDNFSECLKARNAIVTHTGNHQVEAKHLDLGNFSSVRHFVEDFQVTVGKLDVLINNAGAVIDRNIISRDGILLALQVNYFGHFLLTILLIPLLKGSNYARIVNLACKSAIYGDLNLENINSCKEQLGYLGPYVNSKLMIFYFTWELAEKLKNIGITVNCLHPGTCNTTLYDNINAKLLKKYCLVRNYFFAKTAEEGAQSAMHLAISDKLSQKTGLYYEECQPTDIDIKRDLAAMKTVWDQSVKIVGLTHHEIVFNLS